MPVLVYNGPSLLNGQPIIVALTGIDRPSQNRTTGPVVQAYILHRDHLPSNARKSGADIAICGLCPYRDGSCYVLTHRGIDSIWESIHFNHTDVASPNRIGYMLSTKAVRLGAYGDPAAVPTRVWQQLLRYTRRVTGFTHQWQTCDQALSTWCMASVDSEAEAAEAQAKGWRTARTKLPNARPLPNEVICPNESRGVQCIDCGLCGGTNVAGKHVVGDIHGANWKIERFARRAA